MFDVICEDEELELGSDSDEIKMNKQLYSEGLNF